MFVQSDLIVEMPKLRKFASKLTRNVSEGEDLLQATLLRGAGKKHLF